MAREFKQDVDTGEYKLVGRTKDKISEQKSMTEIRREGCHQEKNSTYRWAGEEPCS